MGTKLLTKIDGCKAADGLVAVAVNKVARHQARLADKRCVALNVLCASVANSVKSNIDNMAMLIGEKGAVPQGLFLDNTITVALLELHNECNYIKEQAHQEGFK